MLKEIISYQLRPRVKHLILFVTDRCNLRCEHCFVNLAGTRLWTCSGRFTTAEFVRTRIEICMLSPSFAT